MTPLQIHNTLRDNSLFGALSDERLSALLSGEGVRVAEYAKDEVLCRAGEETTALCVLLHGCAGVFSVDPDRRLLLRTLEKNQIFGIVGLLDGGKTLSMIKAQTSVTLLLVDRETICRLLETDSGFLHRYLGYLTARVRFLNQKILYLTAGQAERRLALYLLSLPRDDDAKLTLPLSMTDLADLLDLGRASLYRAVDRLTADGFLQKTQDGFVLVRPDELAGYYK